LDLSDNKLEYCNWLSIK